MRKEIFIEKLLDEEDRPRRRNRDHHFRGDEGYRHDKGRGIHVHGGRRDGLGPHIEEGCNVEERVFDHAHRFPRKFRFDGRRALRKTKMFKSKDDLVIFVNEIGEKGQKVDIYKIEDDLYKVVYFEENQELREEVKETKEDKK